MDYRTEPRWLEVARGAPPIPRQAPPQPKSQHRRHRGIAALALAAGYAAVAAAIAVAIGSAVSGSRRPAPAIGAADQRATAQPVAVDRPASSAGSTIGLPAGELGARLPFPPDPADRAPRAQERVSMYADGLPCSIGCRPWGALSGWPLAPFHVQHPLRAGLNELRPGSLHVGVDIQAPDGANVYAVQSGYAQILEAGGPNARIEVGNYIYWHINPTVTQGQLVVPFKTVLGTVMAGYGHLAFSELGARGQYLNPLRPGDVLSPYLDRGRPVVGAPALAADGQVIVSGYDPQTFIRRTTYVTPVLAPAALAYRLYDRHGDAVTPLEWAFRGTQLLPWTARRLIYAPDAHAPGYGCFASRTVCVPRWTYRLAGGLSPPLPRSLPPGHYRLTVYAWSWTDHEVARDSRVMLTAAGWKPLGHFPASLLDAPGWTPYPYGYTPYGYSPVSPLTPGERYAQPHVRYPTERYAQPSQPQVRYPSEPYSRSTGGARIP